MIGGFPLPVQAGFFNQAADIVRLRSGYEVESDTVAMDRFSACKAQEGLSAKVLARRPDIVVLQFGSSDAMAPLRRGIGIRWLAAKRKINKPAQVSTQPAGWKHILKWRLWGLASDLLQVRPHSTLNDFLAAYDNMVTQCLANNSSVVVLSPLVMGSARSNRFSRRFSKALAAQLKGRRDCHFLDAHALLSQESLRSVLLYDGFHLSAHGHKLLGEALGEVLLNIGSQISSSKAISC